MGSGRPRAEGFGARAGQRRDKGHVQLAARGAAPAGQGAREKGGEGGMAMGQGHCKAREYKQEKAQVSSSLQGG